MHLDRIRRVGISAAYQAAGILRSLMGNISAIRTKKSAIDLVTEADTRSERAIVETIRSRFPDHSILGEETGLQAGKSDCRWIVDPLDGTTNFAHQLGLFSISIAFALNGQVVIGIVLAPLADELFVATAGEGAALNGRPIRVSHSKRVSESLLVTGFPYRLEAAVGPMLRRFSNCLYAAQGIRRLGSAAIDLCYVACGRLDAFWEQDLSPWDTAAGMLIAKEAGAVVTDFKNRPFTPENPEILASNGLIHSEMLSLLELKDTL